MEILVILMLAAVFFAITMFIVSFIMIRKHQVDKAYQNGADDLYVEDDDDDDDEENNDNFVSNEANFNEVEDKINEEIIIQDVIDENKVEHLELDSENKLDNQEKVIEPVEEVKSDFDENTLVDIIIPKVDNDEVIEEASETDLQEVVNVLINKKNYMFLANNNKVSKGEHIKLLLNKKIYYGLITKANYMRDIKPLKNKPYKLIIIKNNKVKKEEIEVLDTNDIEFVPKRKVQD